ncbi:MAG: hypothetical protein KA248_04245 [Kiritimatiellae bacterium]|nr:hypothetical protein [Kiritimatiellia bacterium]
MRAQPGKHDKRAAGLASALGLLAQTAPATIIHLVPDPEIDSGWFHAPLASWDPTTVEASAGESSGLYPGPYAATLYGCMGYMELAVGTPGGVEYYYDSANSWAPVLSLGQTVGPGHTEWAGAFGGGSGWAASVDTNELTWGQSFYIGYRFESGSDHLYGYAQLTADFNSGDNQTQIRVTRWAYEDTPNTGITIAAVPEPGLTVLLCLGVAGLLLRRFFRRRRE